MSSGGTTVRTDAAVVAAIAESTGQTESEVRDHIAELLATGWLEIVEQDDGATTFALTTGRDVN